MCTLTWTFRGDAFQSEMLPDVGDLGFDYANEPLQANGRDVLRIQIEGDHVAIGFTPTREVPDVKGLEARLRQLCTDCELEFLSLSPV